MLPTFPAGSAEAPADSRCKDCTSRVLLGITAHRGGPPRVTTAGSIPDPLADGAPSRSLRASEMGTKSLRAETPI